MEFNILCNRMSIDHILKCGLGITKSELEILLVILKEKKEIDVEKLIDKLKKNKSNIQRNLKNLTTKNILKRRQINLEKGGFVYVYSTINKEYLKSKIKENICSFENMINSELNKW